uniref:alpha-2,3-sialyltransferase n=1 Tax=Ornithobacterium rhinotracheale TaxID=28251 RepID=UPI00129C7C08|nr:alpha-2,3-sialyltransferase [Ornithobacterium rhinotracheale]
MRTPLIIAGNGPSLSNIDSNFLPANAKVWRCNQFYFEDKYYLGDKIDCAFFNPLIFEDQVHTCEILRKKKEYSIDYIIMATPIDNLELNKPNNSGKIIRTCPEIAEQITYCSKILNKRPTSGINMPLTAISKGFNEIHLTGIDFYDKKMDTYAFEALSEKVKLKYGIKTSNNQEIADNAHSQNMDLFGLYVACLYLGCTFYDSINFSQYLKPNSELWKVANNIKPSKKRGNIFSLSENTKLSEYITTSPKQTKKQKNNYPKIGMIKNEKATRDIIYAKKRMLSKKRIKNLFIKIYLFIKKKQKIFAKS